MQSSPGIAGGSRAGVVPTVCRSVAPPPRAGLDCSSGTRTRAPRREQAMTPAIPSAVSVPLLHCMRVARPSALWRTVNQSLQGAVGSFSVGRARTLASRRRLCLSCWRGSRLV